MLELDGPLLGVQVPSPFPLKTGFLVTPKHPPPTHAHREHKQGVLHAEGFPWPCAQQCVKVPRPLASGKVTDECSGVEVMVERGGGSESH